MENFHRIYPVSYQTERELVKKQIVFFFGGLSFWSLMIVLAILHFMRLIDFDFFRPKLDFFLFFAVVVQLNQKSNWSVSLHFSREKNHSWFVLNRYFLWWFKSIQITDCDWVSVIFSPIFLLVLYSDCPFYKKWW